MTKITIFSGFLGAGKTTLIKKLIAEGYKNEKLVLIENEFGQIGIDGGFLQDAGIEVTEMNSGCICCSLVGDFGEALKKVLEQYHPDRILIEPSGVGKLSDVIRAVQNLEMHDVELDGFTTVVDAKKCKMYQKNFGEFFDNQITYASCLILSHTQGLSQDKLDDVIKRLREKNPKAPIVSTDWDELTGKQLTDAMTQKNTIDDELAALLEEAAHHDHHHHHDDDDEEQTSTSIIITSMTRTAPAAAMTTTMSITIMPTRYSRAGALRRPASIRPRRSSPHWRHWRMRRSTAISCVQRAS